MNLAELRRFKPALLEIAAKYGVSNIRVFGSVARGEANTDSDIDLLVDLDKSTSLMDFASFIAEAEDATQLPLDIVPAECLYKTLKPRALQEALPL